MPDPLVTIVTPSFNQAQYIRATIESVLAQDYPHIEHIVMDGGSTDGTAQVVSDYSSRITWISERDRGQSNAINKGFRAARGEIVSWLNSDDIILPGAVSRAVQMLQSDPNLAAVYGEGYQMDQEGRFKCRFPWTESFNLWKLVYVLDYILQQTAYFRKNVLAELGYLDESLNWGMDWDILIRIGSLYPIGYIPELMGAIREYDTAKSFAGGHRRFQEILRLFRQHSGERYPPAYLFYGLTTYERIFGETIRSLTPKPCRGISGKMQNFVSTRCARRIARLYRESQGLYEDGWAGPQLQYMVRRPRGAQIAIRGFLPDFGSALPEQTIRLLAEEREIGRFSFGPGEFCLLADAGTGCQNRAVRLRLEALHYFVPSSCGQGPDDRKLSYMLKEIGLQDVKEALATHSGVGA
jgi:glycosyltransferase involved in cell wall biosynthesis